MKRRVMSLTGLRGYRSLFLFLALFIILYMIQRFRKNLNMKDRILQALKNNGFNNITACFVFAQAAHETGNFTSPIFLLNNNLFGMKYYEGDNHQTGNRLGYAFYKDLEQSVEDYRHYWILSGYGDGLMTIDQFVNSLNSKGYFEAPLVLYSNGVKHFYNMYFGS